MLNLKKISIKLFGLLIMVVLISGCSSSPSLEERQVNSDNEIQANTSSTLCIDLDGYDYSVKGKTFGYLTTLKDSQGTVTDKCVLDKSSREELPSGEYVIEHSCNEDDVISMSWYKCRLGCVDGRCANAWVGLKNLISD